jgi:hypothetical protein
VVTVADTEIPHVGTMVMYVNQTVLDQFAAMTFEDEVVAMPNRARLTIVDVQSRPGDGDGDVDLGDTVDDVPLALILAVKGLLDAATRLWPKVDDVPPEIRDQLLELNETWIAELERAIEAGRQHG